MSPQALHSPRRLRAGPFERQPDRMCSAGSLPPRRKARYPPALRSAPPAVLNAGKAPLLVTVLTNPEPQHAALTAVERTLIQFAVCRLARGLPAAPRRPRPRQYFYPTMESGLPCSFTAVRVELDKLADESQVAKPEKLDTVCPYCVTFKTFANVTSAWAHVFYKHPQVANNERLAFIQQTAASWHEYLDTCHRKKRENTVLYNRVLQAEQADFSWQTVESWNLRA